MGKNYGKKPRRPKKEDDEPPTEAQRQGRAANALKASKKAASRIYHSFVPRQNHHCGECFGVTDFNTCVKKGHQLRCEIHREWYWRKGHCVKCVREQNSEAQRERDERQAEKDRVAQEDADKNDFFRDEPERKKPGTKKKKLPKSDA